MIGAAVAGSLVGRRRHGRLGLADLFAVAFVAGTQGVTEWTLHRYVLHQPPRTVAGRTIDMAAGHRGHHEEPDSVPGALLGTPYAANAIVLICGYVVGLSRLVPAGRQRHQAMWSTLALGYVGLGLYEWIHLLVHTSVRPRSRRFAELRTNHRLHHFRNEQNWFGVTTTLGDRLLGTLPESASAVVLRGAARHPQRDV